MEESTVYAGIDVSKEQLDVALTGEAEGWSVANTEAGIGELVERFKDRVPTLIVLEATGGCEVPAAAALAAAGLPVTIVKLRQVRDFAKATGQPAKTDKMDAQVLAMFADRVRPPIRPLPDEAARKLDAVIARRRQVIDMLTAEKNRLGFAVAPVDRDTANTSSGLSGSSRRSIRISTQ